MSETFIKEVFNLTNVIENKKLPKEIAEMFKDVCSSKSKRREYIELFQVAASLQDEFQGYLLIDDDIEQYSNYAYLNLVHLRKDDRAKLEIAHKTLMLFIDLCLEEIRKKSTKIYELVSPYADNKEVSLDESNIPFLKKEELENVVNSFKSSLIYKSIIKRIDLLPEKDKELYESQEKMSLVAKEIDDNFYSDGPFTKKIFSYIGKKTLSIQDSIYLYYVNLYKLKLSLKIACNTFYRSIIDEKMIIINDSNLISYKEGKERFYFYFQALVQYEGSIISFHEPGYIALSDYTVYKEKRKHIFGYLISTLYSSSIEEGDTCKMKMIILDENLCFLDDSTNLR